MGLVAVSTAAHAYLMEPVVNRIFVEANEAYLLPVGLAVLGTFILKGTSTYMQSVLMGNVGQRVIADMQHRLFAHVIAQDVTFFHDHSTGKLLSRLTNDVSMMRAAVTNALTGIGRDAASLVLLVGVIFYQDWVLATVSFFVFPLAILPIVRIGKRMRKVTANTQEQTGQLTTLLEQSVQGVRVVKAYGMEEYEKTKVGGIVEKIYELVAKATRVRAASSPIMETLGGVAITVVILYGGSRVIGKETDPGSFFSFITALMMAYQPLKSLANLNSNLQEGLAAAARCFAVLDTPLKIKDAPGAGPLAVTQGAVRFEQVSFSYDGAKQALNAISLEIPAGKTVALVGPSGAGKSTVFNLLPRFYDPCDGRILVDGTEIRDVTLESLRSQIAWVSQEITLFDDTIRNNIRYGRFSAADSEVEDAARHAAAHDFIMALPEGYETMVGERGMRLSGGQRQRLAIARAMLRNAPILLLDEATSALDTESERQVQGALDALMQGRTTMVIAHRLSTVVNADVIYVLDRGGVAEFGSHAQLLAKDGIYARLYALQFADEAAKSAEQQPEMLG